MKVLVIIPTLNSFEIILDTIASIEANAPDVDYIVLDRGSDDRTRVYLENNNIPRLEFPFLVEYHRAVSLGLLYAYENNYDAVIEFDDKGRHNADDIPYFIETFKNKNVDLIFSSRYINGKKKKTFATRWLRFTARASSRKKITDPIMRFKLYSKKVIKFFALNDQYNDPTPDRIIQLIRSGFKFMEIASDPVPQRPRQAVHRGWKAFFIYAGWGLSMIFVQPFRRKADK